MESNYIVKNKLGEVISFYYGEQKSIYYTKITTYNSYEQIKVIDNVKDTFTISMDNENEIYVVCENLNKQVILCKIGGESKIVFENNNDNDTLFYAIFYNENISFIYNNCNNLLCVRSLMPNLTVTNEEHIDDINKENQKFYLDKLVNGDIILTYQRKNSDIELGYKKIQKGYINDFKVVHKTSQQLVDYSFVYYDDTINYIYIIKNLFSSQVVYRKEGYNPVIIFDGQKMRSCSICIINTKIYCKFVIGNNIYYCSSENFGANFSQPLKYTKINNQEFIKHKILNGYNFSKNAFNEVYGDVKGYNLYFISDFLPEFFNIKRAKTLIPNIEPKFITSLSSITKIQEIIEDVPQKIIENITQEIVKSVPQNINKTYELPKSNKKLQIVKSEVDFMANFDLEKFMVQKNDIRINRNYKKTINNDNEIKYKNNQILDLNTKYNQKMQDEIELIEKLKRLEEENKKLKENKKQESKKQENIKKDKLELKDEKN